MRVSREEVQNRAAHVFYDSAEMYNRRDRNKNILRTIWEQLRLKLCQNLRTTSLRQNLLVFYLKKRVIGP